MLPTFPAQADGMVPHTGGKPGEGDFRKDRGQAARLRSEYENARAG